MGPRRAAVRASISFAIILTVFGGVEALQMVPAGNIAGQWPFDRLSGATTPDASGNGGTATLVGAPTLVAGLTGSGLQFNGTNQYLTVANSTSVNVGAEGFSVAVWVNPSDTTQGRILNKWDGAKGWLFDVHSGTSGGASAGALRARFNDGTNDADRTVAAGVVAGAWQHIAMTVDRTGGLLRFYRNGVQVGGDQIISGVTATLANTAQLGIATIPSSTGNFYAGLMDEPVLYRRLLTPAEIVSLATMPPAAPASLTPTNGQNLVTLAWPAVSGAASYNVLRSGTSGGPAADPYVIIASGITGLSYPDPTALNPQTYYYVVQAVAGATPGPNSPQAVGVPLPVPVTALPNSGLQTNENGTTTSFLVTFNVAVPAAGSVVTVTSTDPTEGLVSSTTSPVPSPSVTLNVPPGFSTYIPITVTGVGDVLLDGNVTYPITVTATNMGVTIPDVLVTNNDTNVAGITFTRTSGLSTSENATSDTFSATLNTQPANFIEMTLSSSNLGEAVVSPATLRFTVTGSPTYTVSGGLGTADWNVAHVVTVTGVDDSVLDFTVPYTIQTSPLSVNHVNDAPYASVSTPDVAGVNVDNEVIPELPKVWGGGGSGGCGLLGLEAVLLLVLRRRRRQ